MAGYKFVTKTGQGSASLPLGYPLHLKALGHGAEDLETPATTSDALGDWLAHHTWGGGQT
jgi:hypothetical protein